MATLGTPACCFIDILDCRKDNANLIAGTQTRLDSIVSASKIRGDGLHETVDAYLHNPNLGTVYYHKNCVSTYTSKTHIQRHLSKESRQTEDEPVVKRLRRSEVTSFDFKLHCIFCGKVCIPNPDAHNPARWRKVVQCRTANRESDKTFKQVILDACNERNDEVAEQVRIRVEGAISDLHAADGQYHNDCRISFLSQRSIKSATNKANQGKVQCKDPAFEQLLEEMKQNECRMWNSVELHDMYVSYKGTALSRRQLLQHLSDHFGNTLLILSGIGVASIVVFRYKAAGFLKLVPEEEDDNDIAVVKVAKKIVSETKLIKFDKSHYKTRTCLDDVVAAVSPTLLDLLSQVSPKLKCSMPAGMLGNIVSSIVNNQATPLQISLGLVLHEKALIEQMYKFGICCSYDEVRRFKASAANAATENRDLMGLSSHEAGLVQAVADNFDANISSQNGLRSTHALAILITQPQVEASNDYDGNTIRRLKKDEMKDEVGNEVPVQRYQGKKKPSMPLSESNHSPPTLKLLAQQNISLRRAKETDLMFLKDVTSQANTPEFNGYNTQLARNQGHSISSGTKAVYLPLLDMVPSDPDTIYTAMVEAERLTKQTGQMFTIFTTDQQLYKVVTNVLWAHSDHFTNFVSRLGGMHTLMNFVGAVGTLMADSGLQEVLQAAFGGVPKMLTGKKFPQNVRALRMVTEEILHTILTEQRDQIGSHTQLMDILEQKATKSRTAQVWLNNLIKPVFIMMVFIRAEREADWPLHLYAVTEMIPYFFASGHFNYAR